MRALHLTIGLTSTRFGINGGNLLGTFVVLILTLILALILALIL